MNDPCPQLEASLCNEDYEVPMDVDEPAFTTEAPRVHRPPRPNRAYVLVPLMPKRPKVLSSCLAPRATPFSPTVSVSSYKQVRSEKECREELRREMTQYYMGMANLRRLIWTTLNEEDDDLRD